MNILDIPMDCPKTWALLQNGDTTGVFQLESSGMKSLLQQAKPTRFEDLIAVLALYRPAPLSLRGEDGLTMVERYVKVKNGELEPSYIHPDLEPILGETHGQLVYQEQMMQIAGKFAGFSLGQRDHLRKAMGKKLPEVMESLKSKFIEGCALNGYSQDLAAELWTWLKAGSGYLFNKSHSASYALISWQTAWLKANYPLEFMAATMSAELGQQEQKSKGKKLEKIAFYIKEARESGIEILPPLVEKSSHEFTVHDGKILFGLNAIRGVGAAAISQIIKNRPYANFLDFLQTNVFKGSEVKKGTIVGLIKAGAFDSTDPDRIEVMRTYQETRPNKEQLEKPLVTERDFLSPHSTILKWEREALGIYLSGHPMDKYSFVSYCQIPVGGKATVGGEVVRTKKIKTKRGQDMCFITLDTPEGQREVTVFPLQFNKYKDLLEEGSFVIVEGKKDRNVLADRIRRA